LLLLEIVNLLIFGLALTAIEKSEYQATKNINGNNYIEHVLASQGNTSQ
jgi:hypothetical protein